MPMRRGNLVAASLLLYTSLTAAQPRAAATAVFDSGAISGLGARNIGSAAMSGRIAALAGYDDDSGKVVLFVGSASGGVWKSTDGATTFKPVFDEQPVQSIGAIAVDPSNHQNVWVGTGETWTRNSVSIGDGIYARPMAARPGHTQDCRNPERIARDHRRSPCIGYGLCLRAG